MKAPVADPVDKFVGLVEGFYKAGGVVRSMATRPPRSGGLAGVIAEIDRFYITGCPRGRALVSSDFKLQDTLDSIRPDFSAHSPEARALDAFAAHVTTRGERLPLDFGLPVSYLLFAVLQHVVSGDPLTVARAHDGHLGALAVPNLSASTPTAPTAPTVNYLASTGNYRGAGAAALAFELRDREQDVFVKAHPRSTKFYKKIGFEQTAAPSDETVNMVLPAEKVVQVRGRIAALSLGDKGPPSVNTALQ